MLVLAITGIIFAVVFGLIVYALVRYRRRPDDDGGEPAQVYGSTQVEIAWTVTPVLIVVVLSLTGARAIDRIQNAPRPAGVARRHRDRPPVVVGVPLSRRSASSPRTNCTCRSSDPASPTPTFLKLLSADVAHSFWVPRLAGKTDLIPNRVNEMWIDPGEAGALPRAVRGVLRHPAREDAAARLRARARRLRSLGRASSARPAAQVAERGRGPPHLRDDVLHQLPRGRRHGRHRHVRARPHPSHEPRDARRPAPRRTRPRTCGPGSRARSMLKPGSLMPAMNLTRARARRARGVSRDAAMSVESGGTSVLDTVTLTGSRTGAAPLFDRLHEWVITVDHKRLGLMYIDLRARLPRDRRPRSRRSCGSSSRIRTSTIVSPQVFNRLFTMHGTTMVFFVGIPIVFGIANYLVPLMIGARDMAFPRLNAFSFWISAVRRAAALFQLPRRRRARRDWQRARCRLVRLRAAHGQGVLEGPQHRLLDDRASRRRVRQRRRGRQHRHHHPVHALSRA